MEASGASNNDPKIGGNSPIVMDVVGVGDQIIEIIEIAQPSPVIYKPMKPRAIVYNFFNWDEGTTQWKCTICDALYAPPKAGGTGSLTNHMNRAHKLVFEDAKKEKAAANRKLPALNEETGPREITKEIFRKKLVDFMICTDQAFTLVEDPYFRDLIDYCSGGNKECQLFCAKTARTITEDLYKENQIKMQRKLQNNEGKISYVIDCWTSPNQYPFQGVIAKWISKEWELCSTVVDLTILNGKHSGKNIATAFWDVLKEYGLLEKLLNVTTDNATNMDTMFEELDNLAFKNGLPFKSKNNRVRCFAHILNLACKDMINSVGDGNATEYVNDNESDSEEEEQDKKKALPVVAKFRKGVVAIRNSPQRREQFARQCIAAKIEPKMVLRDVRTRWNATLLMLERGKLLKEPYDLTLTSIPKLRKYVLDDEEWLKVDELIKLLSPFQEATVTLSNEHSPTISRIAAVYQVLIDHLEKYVKNESDTSEPGPSKRRKANTPEIRLYPEWIVQAAKEGLKKLEKYYPSTDGLVYIVGTDVNLPGTNQQGGPKSGLIFVERALPTYINHNYKPSQDVQTDSTPTHKENQPTHLFKDLFNKQMRSYHKSTMDDELKKYLAEGAVDPDLLIKEKTGINGSLGWWKLHEKEYPNLSRMAKDYLAAAGTGVPVERLFSTGPDVVSPRRQSMAQKTIRMCICLKAWVKNKHLFQNDIQNAVKNKFGLLKDDESEDES